MKLLTTKQKQWLGRTTRSDILGKTVLKLWVRRVVFRGRLTVAPNTPNIADVGPIKLN